MSEVTEVKLMERIRRTRRLLLDRAQGFGVVNRHGTGVVGLIDVGSVGNLPNPWHKRSDLLSHVLKFEPRDPRGTAPNVVSIDCALWSTHATLPFYVYAGNDGQGSSLFRQNFDYVRENYDALRRLGPPSLAETWFGRSRLDRVEQLECTTLDSVLVGREERYHILKIDAQGAELEILKGAHQYLAGDNCLALHLELFQLPLYEGIALRPEIEKFLADKGFVLVKEYPPHGSFDSQNDCVFIREGARGPEIDAIRAAYEL